MKCLWTSVIIPKNLTQADRKNIEKTITQSDFPSGLKKERGEKVELLFWLFILLHFLLEKWTYNWGFPNRFCLWHLPLLWKFSVTSVQLVLLVGFFSLCICDILHWAQKTASVYPRCWVSRSSEFYSDGYCSVGELSGCAVLIHLGPFAVKYTAQNLFSSHLLLGEALL